VIQSPSLRWPEAFSYVRSAPDQVWSEDWSAPL
jgi:hypothetical protein